MAHILIVDDEEAIQHLIHTILETAGHSVYEALDGRDALDMLKTHPNIFDVIILDVLMPKMDGFEFLSQLQNQGTRPPIILLSAYSDQIPPPLVHLVSGRLNKPFGRLELIDTVSNLLGEKIPLSDAPICMGK